MSRAVLRLAGSQPDVLANAPKVMPVGYITRDQYLTKYGQEAYDAVPEASWGIGGHKNAMNQREWSRVRGKLGV